MREIRLHGSEGGGAETNRSFLPLSCSVGGVRLQQVDIRRPHPRARTGRVDVSAYGFRGNLAAGNWSLCNRVDHGNLSWKNRRCDRCPIFRMRQDLVFPRDLQIVFAPGPRGADRILERHHLRGVSGGRSSAARPDPFLPWGSGLREATRPFWHPGNVSGPQRPHNARGSRRPRICCGSSNASPLVPT